VIEQAVMKGRSKMDIDPTWEYVADNVMGGVSNGDMRQETYQGRKASVLYGDVSLDNNGGFIQIACNLGADENTFDASEWTGLELDVSGNGERYDIRRHNFFKRLAFAEHFKLSDRSKLRAYRLAVPATSKFRPLMKWCDHWSSTEHQFL
jgi:hypothetical protein